MVWGDQIYGLKETALHGEFTAKIVKGVLGYHGPSGISVYTVATELTNPQETSISLWIRTARKDRALDNLSENIRVGDSLIEDSHFDSHRFSGL